MFDEYRCKLCGNMYDYCWNCEETDCSNCHPEIVKQQICNCCYNYKEQGFVVPPKWEPNGNGFKLKRATE